MSSQLGKVVYEGLFFPGFRTFQGPCINTSPLGLGPFSQSRVDLPEIKIPKKYRYIEITLPIGNYGNLPDMLLLHSVFRTRLKTDPREICEAARYRELRQLFGHRHL